MRGAVGLSFLRKVFCLGTTLWLLFFPSLGEAACTEPPNPCTQIGPVEDPEEPGQDVLLMIDNSQSVQDVGELNFDVAEWLIDYLLADGMTRGVSHRITVRIFANSVTKLDGGTFGSWEELNKETAAQLVQDIQGENSSLSGTDFCAVFEEAAAIVEKTGPYGNPVVVIITDLKPGNYKPGDPAVEEAISAARGKWGVYVDEVPVFFLALQGDFIDKWQESFFRGGPSDKHGGVNRAFDQEQVLDALQDIGGRIELNTPDRVIKGTQSKHVQPYRKRLIFAIVALEPDSVVLEAAEDDAARLAIDLPHLGVWEVKNPQDTEWKIQYGGQAGQALLFVGKVDPDLDVDVGPFKIPVGDTFVVRATLSILGAKVSSEQVSYRVTWGPTSNSSEEIYGEEDEDGWQRWELPTQESDEDTLYHLTIQAVDDEDRIVARREYRICAVPIPEISVGPRVVVSGEPKTLEIWVTHSEKAPDIWPEVQLPQETIEASPSSVTDSTQLFQAEVNAPDGTGEIRVVYRGKTVDDLFVRHEHSIAVIAPVPEPTPCPRLPEISVPIRPPLCATIPMEAWVVIGVSLVFLTSSLSVLVPPRKREAA